MLFLRMGQPWKGSLSPASQKIVLKYQNIIKYRKLENMMKIRYLYVFHTEFGPGIEVG